MPPRAPGPSRRARRGQERWAQGRLEASDRLGSRAGKGWRRGPQPPCGPADPCAGCSHHPFRDPVVRSACVQGWAAARRPASRVFQHAALTPRSTLGERADFALAQEAAGAMSPKHGRGTTRYARPHPQPGRGGRRSRGRESLRGQVRWWAGTSSKASVGGGRRGCGATPIFKADASSRRGHAEAPPDMGVARSMRADLRPATATAAGMRAADFVDANCSAGAPLQ